MAAAQDNSLPTSPGQALAGWVSVLISVAFFVGFWQALGPVGNGEVLRWSWEWVPSLGISLSFLIDGLSLSFALLISGIGALVMLYSTKYLAGHKHFARFFLYLTLFMMAMLGLVLSDNLLSLFVFWELTSITSYLLIGFSHTSADSRRSALQALLVTGGGGLALLAGIILIGWVAGTYELSEIRAQGDLIREHGLYLTIFVLFLLGAFTKSAQIPFHFWLPNAMAAPTPVSAYLHSATMVKAGIYLLARMHPTLAETDVWLWTLTIAGSATAVFASFMAVKQTDLKQILAYTTLMALGTLTLFLAADTGYAITAAMTFLIVHSLYKAALFMIAGAVDHSTGTREIDRLGGLARAMPITTAAAALAALSMAGFPPFLGFIGKELKYYGALAVQSEPLLVAGAVLLANALMLVAAGLVAFRPFWRGTHSTPMTPHEAPWQLLAGPVILAVLGALFGINSDLIANTLIKPGVAAISSGELEPVELKLWAGINLPLILSGITITLGIVLLIVHRRMRAFLLAMEARLPSFDRGWDKFLDGMKATAAWQTRILQSGVMRYYLYVIFATLLVAVGGTLIWTGAFTGIPDIQGVQVKHWVVVFLILAGTALTTITNSRIAGIAGLGAVGIGVALIFIIYSAPDVAITQLLVETLIVVLFAVAALRLPMLKPEDGFPNRKLDALFATAIGAVVAAIMITVTTGPINRRLTEYFEQSSWIDAYGRNIVNVILVDFRALDTFGEIAVVAVAGIAAWAILKGPKEDAK
ncbi:putative monovalent cation/H+ antiporter subunit A [Boseongicola aestuarii]|uniref:Na(+)/H(+) antiporter subunit A n=1 Tax=Boseongicola aestuarii TaxID=1470561 RepID=A0A238J047_9RHOB|nr:putative monovalent cation/H+ antiporter subunit A [Boseongicola aestuarii]SMX23274.1 Na(+)/H(+) antiporter subunit A [Boseongicola aestuarii]